MASAATPPPSTTLPSPSARAVPATGGVGSGVVKSVQAKDREAAAVYALVDWRWRAEADARARGDGGVDNPDGGTDGTEAEARLRGRHSLPLSSSNPTAGGSGGDASGGGGDTVRLTPPARWYTYYASRYPGPAYLERECHLGEIEIQHGTKPKKSKGLFGWLFQRWASDESTISSKESMEGEAPEAPEEPMEEEGGFAERIDDGMCGTSSFLDKSAVVREALAFHRFHLASERRALCRSSPGANMSEGNVALPVRRCVGWDDIPPEGTEDGDAPFYCIVGYGKIAEFPSLAAANGNGGARITLTSDHPHLASLGANHDNPDAPPHDFRHVRAASIGRDCLMVAWGRGDGWVVFYRRVYRPTPQKATRNSGQLDVGWEVVAAASPSRPIVQAAVQNLTPDPYISPDEEEDPDARERRLCEAGLLVVTDLVPMVVHTDSHHSDLVPSSGVVGISRLGGLVELLPLPEWVWRPHNPKLPFPPPPAPGRLPNLSATMHPTAFTTHHHHLDLLCLEAYRTNVGADSAWDEGTRPEGPPAEVILAASGIANNARAAVSFWGITTIHTLSEGTTRADRELVFDVRVRHVGSAPLNGVGAEASVFLDAETAERWAGEGHDGSWETAGRKRKFPSGRIGWSSVTVPAPVVSLRFTPRDSSREGARRVLIAALDYNGGVAVFDSTDLVRMAEHAVPEISSAEGPGIQLLCDRETMMTCASGGKSRSIVARASQIEWWTSHSGIFALASSASLVRSGRFGTKSSAILRLQQIGNVPSDVFSMPVVNVDGSTESVALLPPPNRPGHQILSFLQMSASGNDPPCLSVCGVQKLSEPTDIIATLLRRGDPQRALEVAANFGGAERFGGRVMDECRMQLWEEQGDVRALTLVSDNDYVVGQAVRLVRSEEDCVDPGSLTLDDLLVILREALARAGSEESSSLLRDSIQRLGTFRLLLNNFGAVGSHDLPGPFAKRFLQEFRHEALPTIASCAAGKGDIAALTLILARHSMPMHKRMELLNLVPLGVEISSYEHLLPCSSGGHGLDSESPESFSTSHQLFEYLSNLQGQMRTLKSGVAPIDVFLDDDDRDLVRVHLEECSVLNETQIVSRDEVAAWYLKRAIGAQNESGQVFSTREICKAGLMRLGLVGDAVALKESQVVGKLIYLHSACSLFCQILVGKLSGGSALTDSMSGCKDLFTSTAQFCSMELSETFPLILGGSDAFSVPSFQNHRALFIDGGECLGPGGDRTDVGDLISKLERDVMRLSLDKLKGLQNEKRIDLSPLQRRLEESLTACVDFASFGIRNMPSQRNDNLIDFADEIFQSVLGVVRREYELITDAVMDKLWSVIELLPIDSMGGERDELSKVESLHYRLVALQLCCKWRAHRAVPRELWGFLRSNYGGEERGSMSRDLCMAGHELLSSMCSGFCGLTRTADQDFDLLFDFVSDVDEFDKRFFSSGIQESGCLGKLLFCPLLSQHSFLMLKGILKIRPEWFSQDFLQSVVSSFIQDAARSQDRECQAAALACREILGPILPTLTSDCEVQQHVLDAKRFMCEVMKLDPILLGHLFTVDHADNPIALIEALMDKNPRALLLGCEFWSDKSSAHNACSDASVYFSSQIRSSLNEGPAEDASQVLPPMPGSLVMQLANILGLRTHYGILLVKQCMVAGALKMKLGHAAAAICLSMLCDVAFSRQNNAASESALAVQNETPVLECVAAILSDKSFSAAQIKKEMCTLALRLFRFTDSTPLHCEVVDACHDLDCQLLKSEAIRFSSDTKQLMRESEDGTQHSEFMVFKAADLVARQAMDFVDHANAQPPIPGVHSRNFFHDGSGLFDVLSTGELSRDKEQELRSIGEAAFKWIVAEAFKERAGPNPASSPAPNFLAMVELGKTCLAELGGRGASLIIDRALEEFEKEKLASRSRESSASPNSSIQPDLVIVRRLNDRGYGWNAARRAAIMTNNESYSAALAWAVSHFSEPDFDAPIYFLHSDGSASVNQNLIDMTGGVLQSIKRNIGTCSDPATHGPAKGKELSDPATTPAKMRPPTRPSKIPVPSPVSSPSPRASPLPFKDEGEPMERFQDVRTRLDTGTTPVVNAKPSHSSKFVSKLPSPSPVTSPRASPVSFNDGGKVLGKTPDKTASPVVGATPVTVKRAHTSKFVSKLPSPSALKGGDTPQISKPPIYSRTQQPRPPPSGGGSISSFEGSLSSHAEVKKQIQVGKAKLGTQKLTLDERKKLAQEGKRLLDLARARNKRVTAPPASITTSRRNPP